MVRAPVRLRSIWLEPAETSTIPGEVTSRLAGRNSFMNVSVQELESRWNRKLEEYDRDTTGLSGKHRPRQTCITANAILTQEPSHIS